MMGAPLLTICLKEYLLWKHHLQIPCSTKIAEDLFAQVQRDSVPLRLQARASVIHTCALAGHVKTKSLLHTGCWLRRIVDQHR